MKTLNNLIPLATLGLLFFAACKKNDDGPVLTPKEKILVDKTWKVDSLTIPKISNPSMDSSIAKECSEDALLDFDANKAYRFTDPSKSCDSSLIPYGNGTWSLGVSNDTLVLNGPKKLSWKIIALDNTRLEATFRDSFSPDKIQMKTIILK
jgi:hypothetical protein